PEFGMASSDVSWVNYLRQLQLVCISYRRLVGLIGYSLRSKLCFGEVVFCRATIITALMDSRFFNQSLTHSISFWFHALMSTSPLNPVGIQLLSHSTLYLCKARGC